MFGRDPPQHLGIVDETGSAKRQRQAHRCLRRALRDAGLQQPQRAAFNGELDVLHITAEPFEFVGGRHQLGEHPGLRGAQRVERQAVERAGDDVLALRAGQPFAQRFVGARRGVAAEQHPGAGVRAEVAEHHRLDHYCRAARVVEPVVSAVGDRPADCSRRRSTASMAPRS